MDTNSPFSADLLDQNNFPEQAAERYNPWKDRVYIAGLCLLALSVGFFLFGDTNRSRDPFGGVFMANYVIVWIYMVVLWVNKRLRWWMFGARRADYPSMLLLLLLWLVSCFALNRELEVFRPSVSWLDGYLGISGLACVAFAWHERMGVALRRVLYFALGATAVLLSYYTMVLLPLSGMGLLVFWFFGFSLHGLIPLVFTIYLVLILRNALREEPALRFAAFAGVVMPLLVVGSVAVAWYRVSSQLALSARDYQPTTAELPRWVVVSQHLEQNWLYGHLLKAVAEGTMPSRSNGIMGEFMFSNFGVTENDPLMQIAAAVSPRPELDADECKKIYAAQYDSRNVMEERFWSGHDLLTTSVHSKVMLDPGHRLSYTEKVLTVAHTTVGNSGRTTTQEAIYTFFLPEGGVVTSLSLWINGVEEPGVLTARSKAKEAYSTIVGRERRDPAVVFWQEGNQVRVRVFPVTPDMPRKFKVGVTAPLRYDNQILTYNNIAFDGPSALTATERDSVYFEGNGVFTETPVSFKNENAGRALTFDGAYRHRWSLRCNAPLLARSTFSFDGKTYAVAPWNTQSEEFQPAKIYIDLNEAWTQPELAAVRSLMGMYPVWAATANGLEQLTEQNVAGIFQQSRSLRFSLFPFYKIDDPKNSLLLTKSAAPTPLPSELEGSVFSDGLKQWDAAALRVFHLGDGDAMTAYLRAMREKRDIFCVSGSMDLLEKHLNARTFPQNPESPNTVALPESGVLIVQKDTTVSGKAPDHLFRLFAYNTVLRELGGSTTDEPTDLVQLAEQAYVVTPVSSLVTLETKADYERFDIKPTAGLPSLGNAGAVPEPHEWALIVLLTLGALFSYRVSGLRY